MLETSASNNGRLFQFTIVLGVIAIMMYFLLQSFKANDPIVSREAVSNTALTFSKTLQLIRTEWQIQGRKSEIVFEEYNSDNQLIDSRKIAINKLGWVAEYNQYNELDCKEIWQKVINNTLTINNLPVVAKKIENSDRTGSEVALSVRASSICRYQIGAVHWFDFNLNTGQVLLNDQL